MQMAGSYAMADWYTPSDPEGSSGDLIHMCRRVPGHFLLQLRINQVFQAFDVRGDRAP
jgi:hypothetical protein